MGTFNPIRSVTFGLFWVPEALEAEEFEAQHDAALLEPVEDLVEDLMETPNDDREEDPEEEPVEDPSDSPWDIDCDFPNPLTTVEDEPTNDATI